MRSSTHPKLELSFDAVFYYVSDMESSIAFYRDALGLQLVSRDYVSRFDLDGVLIELVPAPPGSFVSGNGNARLCLSVHNLDEAVEQLHQRGIETSNIHVKTGGRLAFFRDPDDNDICLWEYANKEDAKQIVQAAVFHKQD